MYYKHKRSLIEVKFIECIGHRRRPSCGRRRRNPTLRAAVGYALTTDTVTRRVELDHTVPLIETILGDF